MGLGINGSYPASEVKAVSENPRSPQIPATTITSHTALTGVCVRLLICFHQREPGRALSRALQSKRHCVNKRLNESNDVQGKNNTRCIDTLSSTCDVLDSSE